MNQQIWLSVDDTIYGRKEDIQKLKLYLEDAGITTESNRVFATIKFVESRFPEEGKLTVFDSRDRIKGVIEI